MIFEIVTSTGQKFYTIADDDGIEDLAQLLSVQTPTIKVAKSSVDASGRDKHPNNAWVESWSTQIVFLQKPDYVRAIHK